MTLVANMAEGDKKTSRCITKKIYNRTLSYCPPPPLPSAPAPDDHDGARFVAACKAAEAEQGLIWPSGFDAHWPSPKQLRHLFSYFPNHWHYVNGFSSATDTAALQTQFEASGVFGLFPKDKVLITPWAISTSVLVTSTPDKPHTTKERRAGSRVDIHREHLGSCQAKLDAWMRKEEAEEEEEEKEEQEEEDVANLKDGLHFTNINNGDEYTLTAFSGFLLGRLLFAFEDTLSRDAGVLEGYAFYAANLSGLCMLETLWILQKYGQERLASMKAEWEADTSVLEDMAALGVTFEEANAYTLRHRHIGKILAPVVDLGAAWRAFTVKHPGLASGKAVKAMAGLIKKWNFLFVEVMGHMHAFQYDQTWSLTDALYHRPHSRFRNNNFGFGYLKTIKGLGLAALPDVVMAYLGLQFTDGPGHANHVVFRRTPTGRWSATHVEPHNTFSHGNFDWYGETQHFVDETLAYIEASGSGAMEAVHKTTKEDSKAILQSCDDFCQTWVLLFLVLMIANPGMTYAAITEALYAPQYHILRLWSYFHTKMCSQTPIIPFKTDVPRGFNEENSIGYGWSSVHVRWKQTTAEEEEDGVPRLLYLVADAKGVDRDESFYVLCKEPKEEDGLLSTADYPITKTTALANREHLLAACALSVVCYPREETVRPPPILATFDSIAIRNMWSSEYEAQCKHALDFVSTQFKDRPVVMWGLTNMLGRDNAIDSWMGDTAEPSDFEPAASAWVLVPEKVDNFLTVVPKNMMELGKSKSAANTAAADLRAMLGLIHVLNAREMFNIVTQRVVPAVKAALQDSAAALAGDHPKRFAILCPKAALALAKVVYLSLGEESQVDLVGEWCTAGVDYLGQRGVVVLVDHLLPGTPGMDYSVRVDNITGKFGMYHIQGVAVLANKASIRSMTHLRFQSVLHPPTLAQAAKSRGFFEAQEDVARLKRLSNYYQLPGGHSVTSRPSVIWPHLGPLAGGATLEPILGLGWFQFGKEHVCTGSLMQTPPAQVLEAKTPQEKVNLVMRILHR